MAQLFTGKTDMDFLKYGRSRRDRLPGYFRPKVPGVAAGAVPWHQDKSYRPDANSNPVITVWIPLVDADEVNGCLQIWPDTHIQRPLRPYVHAQQLGPRPLARSRAQPERVATLDDWLASRPEHEA